MNDKAIEAVAREIVRWCRILDGFSEAQAEQASRGGMWKNFRPAAVSAIAAYEHAMWEPIESAPKDGNAILACSNKSGDGFHQTVFWDDECFSGTPGWASECAAFSPYAFTHWRPLPPPPEDEE